MRSESAWGPVFPRSKPFENEDRSDEWEKNMQDRPTKMGSCGMLHFSWRAVRVRESQGACSI